MFRPKTAFVTLGLLLLPMFAARAGAPVLNTQTAFLAANTNVAYAGPPPPNKNKNVKQADLRATHSFSQFEKGFGDAVSAGQRKQNTIAICVSDSDPDVYNMVVRAADKANVPISVARVKPDSPNVNRLRVYFYSEESGQGHNLSYINLNNLNAGPNAELQVTSAIKRAQNIHDKTLGKDRDYPTMAAATFN